MTLQVPNDIKLVILESPYAGNISTNLTYARRAALDCTKRGEATLASHLYYTQFLDDSKLEERTLGIALGLAWKRVADYQVFYCDLGWSSGMLSALWPTVTKKKPFKIRALDKMIQLPATTDQEIFEALMAACDHSRAPA